MSANVYCHGRPNIASWTQEVKNLINNRFAKRDYPVCKIKLVLNGNEIIIPFRGDENLRKLQLFLARCSKTGYATLAQTKNGDYIIYPQGDPEAIAELKAEGVL
jgi:hypothetical protein